MMAVPRSREQTRRRKVNASAMLAMIVGACWRVAYGCALIHKFIQL
jgi:hypothetical protein